MTAETEVILTGLTLDLTGPALMAGAAYALLGTLPTPGSKVLTAFTEMWEMLTGLDPQSARELCDHIVGHHDLVTAAVVPL